MLFPTRCRNLTPIFDGEVVHILHTVEDVGLEGEDVHVLHAEGHVVDIDVEALLDGILEGEVAHVLHAKGAGRVVYVEVETLVCSFLSCVWRAHLKEALSLNFLLAMKTPK